MEDTAQLRTKLLSLWADMERGKISAAEARTHIGFARAALDTLKVEIAAAHLNVAHVPAVALGNGVKRGSARLRAS